jgi:hypothetical protein
MKNSKFNGGIQSTRKAFLEAISDMAKEKVRVAYLMKQSAVLNANKINVIQIA